MVQMLVYILVAPTTETKWHGVPGLPLYGNLTVINLILRQCCNKPKLSCIIALLLKLISGGLDDSCPFVVTYAKTQKILNFVINKGHEKK